MALERVDLHLDELKGLNKKSAAAAQVATGTSDRYSSAST